MQPNYLDERLPRYTSYPTAPHFSTAVGASDYRRWLAELPAELDVSLYVHVPFCRSMCWYCGCHTTVALRDGPIEAYLASLRREIEAVAALPVRPLHVRHLHFGGGTPTILRPEDFAGLLALLRHRFAFAPDAEIAVEIDPRRMASAMIATLASQGVNRASIGIQSFDPLVQRAINRIQSPQQTAEVVAGLRKAGVAAISFDLIYGLPGQSVDSCIETVEQCLALAPDRISVFGYAHLPGFKKHQRRIAEADLPGGEARRAQAEAIAQRLVAGGFVRIGLDHFARPCDPMAIAWKEGRLHRNFQGYPTDACQALLGFGPSAIGRLPQGYVQNEPVIGPYRQSIAAGELPVARGYRLSAEDRLRGDVIERLMCDMKVDIEAVCRRHGLDRTVLADAGPALRALASEGLIAFDGTHLQVAPQARWMVRKVASAFDAHLQQSARRYSPAA